MESRKAKITKRSVDAMPEPAAGAKGEVARLWDTELSGFVVRGYASGRKVYALKYRTRVGGMQRIYTIGTHGSPWTPDLARDAADEALRRVAAGEDPAAEKKEAREALTVAELIDAYLKDGPATKPAKRAHSWKNDRAGLNRHLRPLLGKKVATAITKAEAAKTIRDVAEGKTAVPGAVPRVTGGEAVAHRLRAVASAMWAWGIEHGYIKGANPFTSVKLAAQPVRERFLSREEAGRLLDALTAMEAEHELSPTVGDVIRLLMLTGARKNEIAALRWREVDAERKRLVLPPERTKAGAKTGERHVVLSAPALQILARRRPEDAEPDAYVFAASRGDGHVVGVRRPFVEVCAKAKLPGVRIHDLRHSFASFLIADGASLFLVGKLLGHASARTTERYAHLSSDPLQDAAASVGKKLMPANEAAPAEGPPAEVAQLRPGA